MKNPGVEKRLVEAVLWQRLDEPAFEHCRLWESAEAYDLEDRVLTAIDGAPAEVH
jgi:hypothetical protein